MHCEGSSTAAWQHPEAAVKCTKSARALGDGCQLLLVCTHPHTHSRTHTRTTHDCMHTPCIDTPPTQPCVDCGCETTRTETTAATADSRLCSASNGWYCSAVQHTCCCCCCAFVGRSSTGHTRGRRLLGMPLWTCLKRSAHSCTCAGRKGRKSAQDGFPALLSKPARRWLRGEHLPDCPRLGQQRASHLWCVALSPSHQLLQDLHHHCMTAGVLQAQLAVLHTAWGGRHTQTLCCAEEKFSVLMDCYSVQLLVDGIIRFVQVLIIQGDKQPVSVSQPALHMEHLLWSVSLFGTTRGNTKRHRHTCGYCWTDSLARLRRDGLLGGSNTRDSCQPLQSQSLVCGCGSSESEGPSS